MYLILFNGREVNCSQALNTVTDFLQLFGPDLFFSILWQLFEHFLELNVEFLELLNMVAGPNFQGLGFHLQFFQSSPDFLNLMFGSAPPLFTITNLSINLFQGIPGGTELFFFRQSSFQQAFKLQLEILNRLLGTFPGFPKDIQSLFKPFFLHLHPVDGLLQSVALALERLQLKLQLMSVITIVPGFLAQAVEVFPKRIPLLQQLLFLFIAVLAGCKCDVPLFTGFLKVGLLLFQSQVYVCNVFPDPGQPGVNLFCPGFQAAGTGCQSTKLPLNVTVACLGLVPCGFRTFSLFLQLLELLGCLLQPGFRFRELCL